MGTDSFNPRPGSVRVKTIGLLSYLLLLSFLLVLRQYENQSSRTELREDFEPLLLYYRYIPA